MREQTMTSASFPDRLLRAQQDSVYTDGQLRRFSSPFHPFRRLGQGQFYNLLETGVPENISVFPKGAGKKQPLSKSNSTNLWWGIV